MLVAAQGKYKSPGSRDRVQNSMEMEKINKKVRKYKAHFFIYALF